MTARVIDIRRVLHNPVPIDPSRLTTDDVVNFYVLLERAAMRHAIKLAKADRFTREGTIEESKAYNDGYQLACEALLAKLEALWEGSGT